MANGKNGLRMTNGVTSYTWGRHRHALSCDHAYTAVDDAMLVRSSAVLESPICYDVMPFANPLRHLPIAILDNLLQLTLQPTYYTYICVHVFLITVRTKKCKSTEEIRAKCMRGSQRQTVSCNCRRSTRTQEK